MSCYLLRAMMQTERFLGQQLWRWYILLFIANELDLVYTYFGLSHGVFKEGNPFLRPHLLTLWPIGLKGVALAGLAFGIALVLRASLLRQRRVLRAVRVATLVYAVVLVMHLVNLLATIARG